MISFLVCDKRVDASPQRNPTYRAALAGLKKKKGALGSATKPSRCESAQRMGLRACFKLWSVVTIGLGLLAPSLRAEFVFVANADSNTVSAYRIGDNGALKSVVGSPFPAGNNPSSVAVDPRAKFRLRGG